MRKRTYILGFLLCLCAFVRAQEVPKVHTFLTKDYNALQQNWSITQDCEGYTFIANTGGILIYNGFTWKLVDLPENGRPRSVFKGEDCRIYTTGYEFFGYIDFDSKDEPHYLPIADSVLAGGKEEFWNIFGNKDAIYFQSFSDIYRYDYSSLEALSPPSNIMLGNAVEERLFLPRIEHGMYELKENNLDLINASLQLPESSKIVGICAHPSGQYDIVATQYHGLYRLFPDRKIEPMASNLNDQLKKDQINKILRTKDGLYIIGTILNGVFATRDFNGLDFSINKTNGLANNTVLALYEDRNNKLWIGLDNGINVVDLGDTKKYFYDKSGLLGNVFTSIEYEKELYLGSNQGVFKKKEDGSFRLIENSQGQVWSLTEVDGDLLCGHNSGTYQIKNESFKKISDITGGWSFERIDDTSVLQSTYTGLVVLEKEQNKWQVKARVQDGEVLIQDFEIYQQTLVGYHPYYGICVLKFDSTIEKVLSKAYFNEIDGHSVTGDVQIINGPNGILIYLGEVVYSMEGSEFVQTSKLTSELCRDDERCKAQLNYFSFHQTLDSEINSNNIRFNKPDRKAKDFLIGSENGYIVIPNVEQQRSENLIDIEIDFVKVKNNIKSKEDLSLSKLKAFEDDIEIQFRKLGDQFNVTDLYYKFKGWDTRWFLLPKAGKLDFYNLQDGEYELFVNDSREEINALLGFEIQPHWYESYPGAIFYGLLAMLGIILLNRRQKRKWLKQKQLLQKEKEKELESERIKSRNVQLESEVIYKNKMLANSTMTLVQKNKMLINLKDFISKGEESSRQKLLHLIDKNINSDHDWEIFETTFAEVHQGFLQKLKEKHPALTAGDLRLAAYIRMNLSSKEIAPLMNISLRSIENKRYRLRKKMDISHEGNLKQYLVAME